MYHFIFSGNFVNLILGTQWIGTIKIMQITIPLFAIRLIVSTVSLSVVVIKTTNRVDVASCICYRDNNHFLY